MRKITTSFVAFLMATTLVCTNVHCKKEKDEEKSKTKTELLTEGQWRISGHTATEAYDWDLDGIPSNDLYSQYETCEKDDYLTFSSNGTYVNDEGPSKCYQDDDQTTAGTWTFADNESKMVIDGATFAINELTGNTLRLTYTMSGESETITLSK